ncbi:tyrosine-type recombinase/integrase [Mesorhizobium sp.]|uniref:tyrosine-type recombinase/integrase n=2 Tax=Mesorhizobium TaxID=68287 RepID=UPI00345D3E0A
MLSDPPSASKPARCGLSSATLGALSSMRPLPGRWRWTSSCRSAAPRTAAQFAMACFAGFTSISPSTAPGAQSFPQIQSDSASAHSQRGRVGITHRRMPPHLAGNPSQGADNGHADRIIGELGAAIGEVVRLDRSDVDLANGILLIRKTKFRKDRLVPVHTTTQAALRRYVHERDAAFPMPKGQAFFLSSPGQPPLGDRPAKRLCRGP